MYIVREYTVALLRDELTVAKFRTQYVITNYVTVTIFRHTNSIKVLPVSPTIY